MKIIYCIAGTYRPAGMERVLANKTQYLAENGHEVIIVTTDQRGQAPAFALHPSIRTYDLDINYEANNGKSFLNKLLNYPVKQFLHRKRLTKILKAESADIVVSMFCNDASFIPKIKDGSKKVLEIHFSRFKRLQYGRKGLWAIADKWRSENDVKTASRFDKFIVLTEEDKHYWGDMDNLQVIPNARTFTTDTPSNLESKTVIAVGRYSYQKDLHSLLDIWAMTDHEGWKLWLVGDGEDRPTLEKKIEQLNISDSVVLGRAESNMLDVYQNASILALSSRYEGLPMVLLEAQAVGLPIVSYTCKCGPKDVLTDGKDGFLISQGDKKTFAERLTLLMKDSELRSRMGREAYLASNRFDEITIMRQWDNLFQGLL